MKITMPKSPSHITFPRYQSPTCTDGRSRGVEILLLGVVVTVIYLLRSTGLSTIKCVPGETASTSKSNASVSDEGSPPFAIDFRPPRPFPRAGARAANGTWGYVADVKVVQNWFIEDFNERLGMNLAMPLEYLPLNSEHEKLLVCGLEPGQAQEKPGGFDLLQKIQVHVPEISNYTFLKDERAKAPGVEAGKSDAKVLCVINTDSKRHYLIRAAVETWAWRCDGFFAASDKTVESPLNVGFGAIDIPSETPAQKLQSILSYINDNYRMDYDYFYITPPGTHVIVENLRDLLFDLEAALKFKEVPVYAGEIDSLGSAFVNIAGGILVNRLTVEKFVYSMESCRDISGVKSFGACMVNKVGIGAMDASDANGKLRFHGLLPGHIATSDGRRGKFDRKMVGWAGGRNYSTGADLISPSTVAFATFNTPVSIKRHHALLYRSCPAGTALGNALQARTT